MHPRVAHRLLEEGSYCDDELMAEYLGGMLAGSRTPSGRDDRAVAWSELITSLSAVQIKAHYLLYTSWALLLKGRVDINLAVSTGRNQATLDVELAEFATAITQGSELEVDVAQSHAIPGLARVGLLDNEYGYGPREGAARGSSFSLVLRVQPSVAGIELFGWAMGDAALTPHRFISIEVAEDPSLPDRLVNTATPKLPDPPSTAA